MQLSILDQSPIRKGSTATEALQETLQLAQLADRLGYTRFWVSEHHNTTVLAGSAPEVLVAHLASQTKHIRLGTGGVMLPHYAL
jgi:luciferase family oxidoreductase group 1